LETILKEHRFWQLDESMTQLLQQAAAGTRVSDINAVLLVGGTVQMPAVQTWVQQYFEPEKFGVSARLALKVLSTQSRRPTSRFSLPQLRHPLLEPPPKSPQLAF